MRWFAHSEHVASVRPAHGRCTASTRPGRAAGAQPARGTRPTHNQARSSNAVSTRPTLCQHEVSTSSTCGQHSISTRPAGVSTHRRDPLTVVDLPRYLQRSTRRNNEDKDDKDSNDDKDGDGKRQGPGSAFSWRCDLALRAAWQSHHRGGCASGVSLAFQTWHHGKATATAGCARA